ncbi:uncharacterized protein LOC144627038, partial [Crassostrea virginica]
SGSFSNRPSSESASSASSQRVFDHLSSTSQHLLAASLSKSSAKAYHRSWSLLQSWKSQLTLPLTVVDVCNFIGFLFTSDYSPSSIASHISAISYVHKVMNIDDPTQAFVTKKILKGCQCLGSTKDTRLPITPEILRKIIHALNHTVPVFFQRCLLRSLFLLAFHAFLRLGEITTKSTADAHKVLQRSDLHFEYNGSSLKSVQIVMRDFKTNKNHTPIIISLQAMHDSSFCPVQALFEYLHMSKHTSGPLFQTLDAQPISYSFVSAHLRSAIKFVGLDPLQFKGHSFRIGAATYAASLGYSDQLIKKMGRWNSDVFHRYIRIQAFKL